MDYFETYTLLKDTFSESNSIQNIASLNLEIINIPFKSKVQKLLYIRNRIKNKFLRDTLGKNDSKIKENKRFTYSIFKKPNPYKSKNVILLLHGLNEKDWTKYLPWAKELMEKTGKEVILFPIAFHMNRAPRIWKDPKIMSKIIFFRKMINPSVEKETFVNVALSSRLQSCPQRFCLSGLETIIDINNLVKQIRNDEHPYISKEATIDFFSFSIGGFLTEIILMSDKMQLYKNSKAFLFCSGSTFNLMDGVSKYILDSAANEAIKDFFVNHFEDELLKDKKLNRIISNSIEGFYFNVMLNNNKFKEIREHKFAEISKRVSVLTLTQDKVISPLAIKSTLHSNNKQTPRIAIEEIDLPYKYTHENPFPFTENNRVLVDQSFQSVFAKASSFLKV